MSRQWRDKYWSTVEKQSCTSRTTNMQNTLRQHSLKWRMYLNYLSTISQPWATNGDCNGEMVNVRDNGQQITTTLPQHIRKNWNILGGKKYEIEWSCDKWSGYKTPWFHSYFIILRIVSHHYGSSSQTTTCVGVNSVRWSTEYCSTPASASANRSSVQAEVAATMVVSTVVAETAGVWAIW